MEENKKSAVEADEMQNGKAKTANLGKTDLGLEPNIAAALCYIPYIGLVVSIVVLLVEKENKFMKFHAFQSLSLMLATWVISFIVGIFSAALILVAACLVPFVGLIGLALLVYELYVAYMAYKGEKYMIPVLGEFVEKNFMK